MQSLIPKKTTSTYMIETIVRGVFLIIFMFPIVTFAQSYQDVIGKTFINGAGSGSGTFLMSISVNVKGRNTVEIGFITGEVTWTSPDITVLEDGEAPTITRVMVNCKSKTYSPQPEIGKGDAYSHKEYLAGSKYKWDDFSSQTLIFSNSIEYKKPLSNFFKTACEYTAK